MFKTYSLLAICILVFMAFTLSAQEVNVTGDWEMTFTGRMGERTITINFKQEGEKLIVTMPAMRGEGEVKGEGTVKGNEIEWKITRTTPQGEFTITYKGKVEGDSMSGTFEGPMGRTTDWKATSKK